MLLWNRSNKHKNDIVTATLEAYSRTRTPFWGTHLSSLIISAASPYNRNGSTANTRHNCMLYEQSFGNKERQPITPLFLSGWCGGRTGL